ncbi:hypothetical protein C8R45DRAFT_937321 [Mycena sanguinolenta]|nr:hypothetical protein C8R45DRAFT_937321 [Mycena sanguinolenta]
MPRQPTVTEIRLENLTACLTPAVTLLNELNDAFAPSFVQPISNTIASLLKLVQNVKQNKKQCAELLENIHQVLFAIIDLHSKSEAAGSLSLAMTEHVGTFMKTLHKIHIYIEAQQDRNKLKQLFRHLEMNNLIGIGGAVFKDIREMKKATENKHKELLELISTMSETNTTIDGSSIHLGTNESKNSSNSFSLLPSKPKIFHGRETEVESIMKVLDQQSPRIAILGRGGMGKTSLAQAVLHNPETSAKFEERYFVNNLETVWESRQSRGKVEEFLSLLTGIQHLALIITMRGAERPAKVQWSHLFLSPLQPLSDVAAEQTFLDITDNVYPIEDLNRLLKFTDNMPLAVDLISHLVDYEGLENVLNRWETDKTSILSVGILSCKAVLLATSLAYQNGNKQLLVPVPVREHILKFLPPPPLLIHSLCKHFHALLKLYQRYIGEQLHYVISQITINLANLQENRVTPLMDQIQYILGKTSDPQLQIHFLSEVLRSLEYYPWTQWLEELIIQGISHFKQVIDPVLEYSPRALQFMSRAQELAKSSGDNEQQFKILIHMAEYKIKIGDYSAAQEFATEAQQIAEVAVNLHQSASAFYTQASCARALGNYRKSVMCVDSARKTLEICGLPGGIRVTSLH